DLTGDGRGVAVASRGRAARDYGDGQLRVVYGRERGEQTELGALAGAGAGLAGDGLKRVVGALARPVGDRADHAGDHALHVLLRDLYVALDGALEADVLFGRARLVRDEEVPAVGDGRRERGELYGRHLDVVAVRGHMVDGVALLEEGEAARRLRGEVDAGLLAEAELARVLHHLVEADLPADP